MIVGFSIFLVAQQFQAAQWTAESEASSLEDLYRIAEQYPEPERQQIQDLTASCARVVVQEEWPLMRDGRASSRAGDRRGPAGHREGLRAQHRRRAGALLRGFGPIHDLNQNRSLRLLGIEAGLPAVLWVILVVGGIITVAFAYLFGIETFWLHS